MTATYFTTFPLLSTEKLTLRKLSPHDARDIYALRSNPQINKYLNRQPAATIEDALNFINQVNKNIQKEDSLYWAITLTDGNIFAGTICLYGFSEEENKCEIGYELLPDFQGRGIMQEAITKVIEYAFQILKFNEIEAFTHKNNDPSTRLLIKAGFKRSANMDDEIPDCDTFIIKNPSAGI